MPAIVYRTILLFKQLIVDCFSFSFLVFFFCLFICCLGFVLFIYLFYLLKMVYLENDEIDVLEALETKISFLLKQRGQI